MRHGITVFCYGWGLGSGQRAASEQQKQRRTEQNSQRRGERGEGEGTGEQANIRQRLWSTAAWDEAERDGHPGPQPRAGAERRCNHDHQPRPAFN